MKPQLGMRTGKNDLVRLRNSRFGREGRTRIAPSAANDRICLPGAWFPQQ